MGDRISPSAGGGGGAVAACVPACCRAPWFARSPAAPPASLMLDKLRPAAASPDLMALSKTVAWLNEQLERGSGRLLLMDCRAQELYESSHIESAISVALPGLMLRRLQKGNLPLRALFASGEEEREKFAHRCGTDTVVLYDESSSSSDWNENTAGHSVLGLLLQRLKDDGCKAFYLEGEWRVAAFAPGRAGRGRWGPGDVPLPPPAWGASRHSTAAANPQLAPFPVWARKRRAARPLLCAGERCQMAPLKPLVFQTRVWGGPLATGRGPKYPRQARLLRTWWPSFEGGDAPSGEAPAP